LRSQLEFSQIFKTISPQLRNDKPVLLFPLSQDPEIMIGFCDVQYAPFKMDRSSVVCYSEGH